MMSQRRRNSKKCSQLKSEVGARLAKRWSPQQISATLRQELPDEPDMWISHEAIYQALFVQDRCIFPVDAHRLLRTGRPRRRAQRCTRQERRGKNPNMVMISERPVEATDRLVPGHWEGDLVRHEALFDRAVMKGHRRRDVAAARQKLRAA